MSTRALLSSNPAGTAPYVYPLQVDDDARVYHALRSAGVPVFRWDRVWPSTPQYQPGDMGPGWSRQVLQLLCHQDLSVADVVVICQRVCDALGPNPRAVTPLRPGQNLLQTP